MSKCKHCWHNNHSTRYCAPPLEGDVCCLCGETRYIRLVSHHNPVGHGPYHPYAEDEENKS